MAAALDQSFTAVEAALQAQAGGASGALAEVLEATAQMAGDPALRSQSLERVKAGRPPVAALDEVIGSFASMFAQAGGYLAERVTDLRSVRDRIVAEVMGLPAPRVPTLTKPSIIVARDLSPADTAALDLDRVLAIVTELGGPTGHTAIIAGQLGLPCLVQVAGVMNVAEGTVVGIDAASGTLTLNPDANLRAAFERRAEVERMLAKDTAPGATSDGKPIGLLANIGTAEDAERVAPSAAEGVGLFRTEVLFLGRAEAPSVEEQAEVYTRALKALGGRKVVVRTLDAGADKPLAFATQPDEENPALGVRGYRLVRILPDLVENQFAALAAAREMSGIDPWVMAPMIATPAEAKDFARRARAHGVRTVGVMVEIPAAALSAAAILAEVDFVSLGTNDLAQYAMATDRLRGELSDLLDMWQPSVLELVAATSRAGATAGKPVGVCGESASDPLMSLVLAGLGITSLSMAPGAIPAVRFALRQHSMAQCQAMARSALSATSPHDAREAVIELMAEGTRHILSPR